MDDYFGIDSHKLIFHIDRLNDWLKGKTIYPIYLEIAPAGGCNHRCIFCALDYLGYKPEFLNLNVLKIMIKQASALGVKSVMYAGEGEPLLHKDIGEIVQSTKKSGIDVAITTNAVLLRKEFSGKILRFLSWLRVSFNAGRSKTYARIHRAKREDFFLVIKNLEEAIKIKDRDRLKVTIGGQLLLIPENVKEVFILVKILKDIGLDYLIIKPYSQHPLSGAHIDPAFKYENYAYMGKRLQKMGSENFKIIFREKTMERLNTARDYRHCLGLPFWAYLSAEGDIYACSAFLGRKEFCYGNIYKDDFRTIMYSKRKKDIIERVSSRFDVTKCRYACRLDKINSYLWELKHPPEHVNFI